MNRRIWIALAALLSVTNCEKRNELSEVHYSNQSRPLAITKIRTLVQTAAEGSGIESDELERLWIDDTGENGEVVVVVHATLSQLSGFLEGLHEEGIECSQIVLNRTGAAPSTPEELDRLDRKAELKTEITICPRYGIALVDVFGPVTRSEDAGSSRFQVDQPPKNSVTSAPINSPSVPA